MGDGAPRYTLIDAWLPVGRFLLAVDLFWFWIWAWVASGLGLGLGGNLCVCGLVVAMMAFIHCKHTQTPDWVKSESENENERLTPFNLHNTAWAYSHRVHVCYLDVAWQ